VVEEFEGERYFLAEVPWRAGTTAVPAPSRLVIVWDASGSAARRDRGRELQALDAYLRGLPRVAVTLIVARDRADRRGSSRCAAASGGACAPRSKRPCPTARATPRPGCLPPGLDPRTTVALLFSDGLANWGEPAAPAAAGVPLHTLERSTRGGRRAAAGPVGREPGRPPPRPADDGPAGGRARAARAAGAGRDRAQLRGP
jgi:hypothetical protein